MARRTVRWKRLKWGVLLALGIAGGAGVHLVTLRPAGNPAAVRVVVPKGASLPEVVDLLAAAGLAPHPAVMQWTLRLSGVAEGLRAGTFHVPGDANPLEVAQVLAGRDTGRVKQVAIPRGASVWEVARRLEQAGFASQHELLALAADQAFARDTLGLPVEGPRAPRPDGFAPTYLEGFLHPDTYPILQDTTVRDLVRDAADRFRRVWADVQRAHPGALARIRREHRLTEADLVTLASLVDEEIARDDEAPRVAGVFYNRLARGMKLETDPTLTYRPDRAGEVPTPDDRRRPDNPYNTYHARGLPPGPICSPSRAALAAVLAPERHGYLFFVARGGGRHAFSRTFAEHQRRIEQHLRVD
jgi:UPF0755 protein